MIPEQRAKVHGTKAKRGIVFWIIFLLGILFFGYDTYLVNRPTNRSSSKVKSAQKSTGAKTAPAQIVPLKRGQSVSIKFENGFTLGSTHDVHIQPLGPKGQKSGQPYRLSDVKTNHKFIHVVVTASEDCTLEVVKKKKSSFLPWK